METLLNLSLTLFKWLTYAGLFQKDPGNLPEIIFLNDIYNVLSDTSTFSGKCSCIKYYNNNTLKYLSEPYYACNSNATWYIFFYNFYFFLMFWQHKHLENVLKRRPFWHRRKNINKYSRSMLKCLWQCLHFAPVIPCMWNAHVCWLCFFYLENSSQYVIVS